MNGNLHERSGAESASDTCSSSSAGSSSCTIGIGFGRTKREAAFIDEGGNVALIPLEPDCCSLPSFVSLGVGDSSWEVGRQAVRLAKAGHPYTVFDLTMMLGRQLGDLSPKDLARWSFTVKSTLTGKAVVEGFVTNGPPDLVYLEQIAANLLWTIKQRAETFTGKTVSGAVLCIPASFNRTQRRAVRDACTIAGLRVDRIIASSTASAVANAGSFAAASDRNTAVSESTVLVVDCGGGSIDVSLAQIRVNRDASTTIGIDVLVKAVAGNLEIGGEVLTEHLVKHFNREAEQAGGVSMSTSTIFSRRLKRACSMAKKMLSKSLTTTIALPPMHPQRDQSCGAVSPGFSSSMSRADFENVCGTEIWTGIVNTVQRTLELGEMAVGNIDLVLVSGGSMRVPKIRACVEDLFATQQGRVIELPEHTAAIGAALMASQTETLLHLHEPTPLALNVDAEDNLVVTVTDIANKRTTVVEIAGDESCLAAKDIALAKAQLSQMAGSDSVPSKLTATSPAHLNTLRSYIVALQPMVQTNSLAVCVSPGDLSMLNARIENAAAWLNQVDQDQQLQNTDQQRLSAREHLRQIRELHLLSIANRDLAQLRHQLSSLN